MTRACGGPPVPAIVPVKALGQAKSRLAPRLEPAERRALMAWMLDRVLNACAASSAIAEILVIAGDEEAAALVGSRPELQVLLEPRPGLGSAIERADEASAEASATAVIAADLPLLEAADLDALCAAGADAPGVVVAPTADGGTGALLRRPPRVIRAAFGPRSAAAHLAAAARAGVAGRRLNRRGLTVDIDTPAHLEQAARWAPMLRRWVVSETATPAASRSAAAVDFGAARTKP